MTDEVPNSITRTFDLETDTFQKDYHDWVNKVREDMANKHGLLLIGITQMIKLNPVLPHCRGITLSATVIGVI